MVPAGSSHKYRRAGNRYFVDATVSVDCTAINDEKKVVGILNEIKGLKHDGTPGQGVPAVFGMNFQAVSVGQKLAHDNSDGSCPQSIHTGQAGGYLDGSGTPTPVLTNERTAARRSPGCCGASTSGR